MVQQGRIENEELHRAYIELQKISSAAHEEARKQFVQLQAAETRINAVQKVGQDFIQQNEQLRKELADKEAAHQTLVSGLRSTRGGRPIRPARGHSAPAPAQATAEEAEAPQRKRTLRESSPSLSSHSIPPPEDTYARGRGAF